MVNIQVPSGKADKTINTNNVWDRIVALEDNVSTLPTNANLTDLTNKVDANTTSLAQKVPQIEQRNALIPLDIPSYDGLNQGCHPKILYFATAWNGYKWWMAYTPFSNSNDSMENPAILASNDGVKWEVPAGLVNPLATADSYDRYYSDTHLVMKDNVMECWYRKVHRDVTPKQEMIWRKTSTDGINWTAAEQLMYREVAEEKELLSPAVIWDSAISKYRIWAINQTSATNPKGIIQYYESATGANWQLIRTITRPTADYTIWHLDVEKTDVGYEMLISTNAPKFHLYHAVTADNINLSEPKLLIQLGRTGAFDDTYIYRASLTKVNDKYYVFYSASDYSRKWGIGLSVSEKPNDIFSIRGFASNSPRMSKDKLVLDEFGSVSINGEIKKLGNGYIKDSEMKMSGNSSSIILRPVLITENGTPKYGYEILRGDNFNRALLGVEGLFVKNIYGTGGSTYTDNVYATNRVSATNIRLGTDARGELKLQKNEAPNSADALLFNQNGTEKRINAVNVFPLASRPTDPYNGYQYFDTTKNKLVMYINYSWVDAMGNPVY